MRNGHILTLSALTILLGSCGKTGFSGSTPFGADGSRKRSEDQKKKEGSTTPDSENGSKSEQYSDGDINDPVNIAGTYLTCGTALTADKGGPAMGCTVLDADDRPMRGFVSFSSVVVTTAEGQTVDATIHNTYWSRYWHVVFPVASIDDIKSVKAKYKVNQVGVESTARSTRYVPTPDQSKGWFKKRSKDAPVGTDWDRLEELYLQKVLSGKYDSKGEGSFDGDDDNDRYGGRYGSDDWDGWDGRWRERDR